MDITEAHRLAKTRIAHARKCRTTTLDLGDLCIEELPNDWDGLDGLETLYLGLIGVAEHPSMAVRRAAAVNSYVAWNLEPLTKLSITHLNLAYRYEISDLQPLASLPLRKLELQRCLNIVDLTPLRSLPLRELDISWCNGVSSLEPLICLPLRKLNISHCDNIFSIDSLNKLPLTELNMSGCNGISNLEAITGLPLRTLELGLCSRITDLGPLRGMPLIALKLEYCDKISSLEALCGLPLHELNLRGCDSVSDFGPLATLPLTSLSLGECYNITSLDVLQGLPLQKLSLRGCHKIFDLEPLRGMPLVELDLTFCSNVTSLEALRGLPLQKLRIRGCTKVADVDALSNMPLKVLEVSDCNNLSCIEALSSTALTHLKMRYCPRIYSLESLRALPLEQLDVTRCKRIDNLDAVAGIPSLKTLRISGSGIPIDHAICSSDDATAILRAWRYRFGTLDEVKLLVVGQGSVGKTTLQHRVFGGDPFCQTALCIEGRTEGFAHRRLAGFTEFAGRSLDLNVWDFGGQSMLHASHRFFMGFERCLYMLVLDATRPPDGEDANSNRLNYWLRTLAKVGARSDGKKAPIIIVVSKTDEIDNQDRAEELTHALNDYRAKKWCGANVVDVISEGLGWNDVVHNVGLDRELELRHIAAIHRIRQSVKGQIPNVLGLEKASFRGFHEIRKWISGEFTSHNGELTHHINIETNRAFNDFCALRWPHLGKHTVDATLVTLKALGEIHWVGDLGCVKSGRHTELQQWIANPRWVMRPIYDVFWHGRLRHRNGVVSTTALNRLWDETERHPRDEVMTDSPLSAGVQVLPVVGPLSTADRNFLRGLMNACGLTVEQDGGQILIPDLLEAKAISDLQRWETGLGDQLVYRPVFNHLPEKIFLRFFAEHFDKLSGTYSAYRNEAVFRSPNGCEWIMHPHYSPAFGEKPFINIVIRGGNSRGQDRCRVEIEHELVRLCRSERIGAPEESTPQSWGDDIIQRLREFIESSAAAEWMVENEYEKNVLGSQHSKYLKTPKNGIIPAQKDLRLPAAGTYGVNQRGDIWRIVVGEVPQYCRATASGNHWLSVLGLPLSLESKFKIPKFGSRASSWGPGKNMHR